MNCHDASPLLDAYIDNELDAAETQALRDHVDGCGECRLRLHRLESLGRLVRSMPTYQAPDRLRVKVATTRSRMRISPTLMAWAAAIIVAVTVGGGTAIRTWQAGRTTTFVAENVVGGHVKALMADEVVQVRSSNQHTVKPWFQGKLDFSPPVVDLASSGFPLVGGRVDSVAGRTVASLVYQRREHIIDLFVWPEDGRGAAGDTRTVRGFQVRHWVGGGMSFWATSDLNDRELSEFVRILQSPNP